MASVPLNPKIYHITHVDNLAQIVRQGGLWSDAKLIELGLEREVIGISSIKARRLTEIAVKCHPGTVVGQYVPFYLCMRSIMLYILHMGNHPDLVYHGGQAPIVHLVADLRATAAWAEDQKRTWAFSNCNAGTRYADFYDDLDCLDKVDWDAVGARDFRQPAVKEGKQAEFLVFESFPWQLVERIGAFDASVAGRVQALLGGAVHQPAISVERSWYF
ncbi:MAG: DUF4433 domain-containing protein [Dehalococcoidia bacterium]|nr:DUF4433 domain-containing protein [Dehalococcoidia bacterium]